MPALFLVALVGLLRVPYVAPISRVAKLTSGHFNQYGVNLPTPEFSAAMRAGKLHKLSDKQSHATLTHRQSSSAVRNGSGTRPLSYSACPGHQLTLRNPPSPHLRPQRHAPQLQSTSLTPAAAKHWS